MDRIAESLKSKIMSAEEAAKMIKSGMTIGVSGFTNIGYPKAVPWLCQSDTPKYNPSDSYWCVV